MNQEVTETQYEKIKIALEDSDARKYLVVFKNVKNGMSRMEGTSKLFLLDQSGENGT